jgi:hypothetical protein
MNLRTIGELRVLPVDVLERCSVPTAVAPRALPRALTPRW